MLFDGKTVVVTGSNSGIGEAICVAAAAEGANIVIDYVAHPEETTSLLERSRPPAGTRSGSTPTSASPTTCTG